MVKRTETLDRLYEQMIDDLQALNKLLDRQAAGEDVTRELEELENALDVKIALTGALRDKR